MDLKHFATCRHILMHPKHMAFGNIVAKEEIVRDEQFLLLPQCFKLYSIIIFSWICRIIFQFVKHLLQIYISLHSFANILSKLSAADLLYVRNR